MSEPIDLRFVASNIGAGTWLQWAPSFTSVKDLVDQAIAAAGDRCIRRLVIAGHGTDGGAGLFTFDPLITDVEMIHGDDIRDAVRTELLRLKPHLCDQAIIEFRVCNFGEGRTGARAVNAVANLLGVPVTAPKDKIKALGLVGGLTVDWFTAYPDDWGKDDVSSFWRGEPEARPADVAPLRPIEQAHVPVRGVEPPRPIPEPVYGDPPAEGDAEPAPVAGGRRWSWWWVAVPLLLALIALPFWLGGNGDVELAEPATDAADAATDAATEAAADDATAPEPQAEATTPALPSPSPSPQPVATPREVTVTQLGFGDSRAAARGWYQQLVLVAVTLDPAFWEVWFGTYPGSVVMFNAYGPPGSIPAIEEWDQETAAAVREMILASTSEGADGVELDWDALLEALGADPAEVCGGMIVLDTEADQGGDLPGFDAAGDLTGSGQYTGQTAACTGDFEIGLEATLAP